MLKLAHTHKKAIEWKRLWDKESVTINKGSGVSAEKCLPKWCSLVLAKHLLNSFLTLHHLSLCSAGILNTVINLWRPSCSSLYSEKLSCKNDSLKLGQWTVRKNARQWCCLFIELLGQTTKSSRKKHFLLESLPSCMFNLKPLSRSSRHCKDVSQHILSNECWHSTAS